MSRGVTPMRRQRVDELIVATLASGGTRADAATAAGVSERTVTRRLRDPAFRARIDDCRGDMLGQTLDVLSAGSIEAALALRAIIADPAEPTSSRVSACRTLLSAVTVWRDQFELAERIDALERQADHRGHLGVVR